MGTLKVIGSALYQWEIGRKIRVLSSVGDRAIMVQFAHPGDKEALSVTPREENGVIVADVPNILLQSGDKIVAFLVEVDANRVETTRHSVFHVVNRPKPADYIYTETEVLNYTYLDNRLKDLEGEGLANAVADYLDKNPPQAGATEEEKKQIQQNKTDIEELQEQAKSFATDSDLAAVRSAIRYEMHTDYARKDYVDKAISELEIPGGGSVELDTSLTQSGKAADAKAVGEMLATLTLGQHTDGLIYIFLGGKPVGNGLSITSGEVVEPVYGQPVMDNAILSIVKGQTVQLGVMLDKEPTQEQTITVSSESDMLTFDKNKLTFTPDNWNVMQFVSVTAGDIDADTTATIVLKNSDKLMTDTNIVVYLTADGYAVDTTIPTEGQHIVTVDDFESVTASGTDKVYLGAYKAEHTNIYVPAKLTVEGVEKAVILRGASGGTFRDNTTIEYVTVADGVYASEYGQAYKEWTSIFQGCTSLIGVKYEGSDIEEFGGTFKGCTSLKFFDGVANQVNCTDLWSTFDGCTALEYLPDLSGLTKLTRIWYAFQNCSNLKKIYGFPDALASAGSAKMTFYNTALKYVKIPANVNDVFYCCALSTNLERCDIYTDDLDSTNKKLDSYTFKDCNGLTVYCNDGTTTEETLRSVFGSSTNVEIRTFSDEGATPTIAVWGDSTSSPGTSWGCWPDRLQEKIGAENYFVKNQAVSGEYTTSTSARQGGNALSVGAFTIPADTSLVEITLTSADGQTFGTSPVFSAGGGFNPCTIAGVQGSIINAGGGVCKFARKTAGESVEVSEGAIVTSDADGMFNNADAVMLVNLGINAGWNENADTLLNQVQLMVNHFTESGGTKYIITGAYAGQFMRTDDKRQKVFEYETKAATAFGEHWMNLREYLIANGLTENGLTASTMDTERIAVGQIPASLLGAGTQDNIAIYDGKTVTDDTHPNAYGANSICNAFYAKGQSLGYW